MGDNRESKKNSEKTILIAIVCACVVVVFLAIVLITGDKGKNEKTAEEVVTKSSDATVSVEVLEENLHNMQTLITENYDFTYVETYNKQKKILFISVDSEFVYSYDGTVTAGIDMGKVSVTKDDTAKKVIVSIPSATVQQTSIDYDSFRKYSEKEGLWNKLTISDYNAAQSELTKKAEERAIEKGIIEKANENAKTVLDTMIKSIVGDDYTIIFEQQGE